VQVGNCNDDNLMLRGFVDYAERETSHLTTADGAAQRLPRLWEFLESAEPFPMLHHGILPPSVRAVRHNNELLL